MFGRSCLVTIVTLVLLVVAFIISLSSGTPSFSPLLIIVGYSLLLWFGSLAVNSAILFWKTHEFIPKDERQRAGQQRERTKLRPQGDRTSSLLG